MPSTVKGKLWDGPQWKVLPSCLCSFLAHFPELVPRRDMRQNFLVEDLLGSFDDVALCGASMLLDRGAECSCLLQGLHHVETSIPVPLKHILPQKFTTQLLVQTLRKIDQLPVSTEASVRESTYLTAFGVFRRPPLKRAILQTNSLYTGPAFWGKVTWRKVLGKGAFRKVMRVKSVRRKSP